MPYDIAGRSNAVLDRPMPEISVPQSRYLQPAFTRSPGDPIALRTFTGPLWRHRKSLLGMALLGVIGGALVGYFSRPVYRAHTSVQVESFQNDQVTPISSSVPNASADNYLQNQVKILESDTLALRVSNILGSQPISAPRPSPFDVFRRALQSLSQMFALSHVSETERRIGAVRQALGIRTTLQSQVIDISFDSYDPQQAARGANAARTTLVDMNREAREQLIADTTDWLNRQAAELKATVQAQNQRLQYFAQQSGLILAGNEGTVAQARTRETQEALARAEADRAAKQSRFEIANAKDSELPSDAQATGPIHQYQLDLEKMRADLAQLQTIYTPTNYKVERLKAQIAETERAIAAEQSTTISRLGSEYAAATRLEKLLSDTNSQQLRNAEQEMANDRQYAVLKSESDATEKLYETVLEKAKEAGAASALHATNIRTIDSAIPPFTPYSPQMPLDLAVGLALGALGGVAFAFLGERSDKVKRPGEIRVLDIPELGAIPAARDTRRVDQRWGNFKISGPQEIGLVARDHRTSIMSESFRGALTSIIFGAGKKLTGDSGGRVLVVASVDAMEGKTTVLTNLGVVAAERRQRVLLIDADLRRPTLHKIFRIPNDNGLTDVLKRVTLEAADGLPIVKSAAIPGLSILPSGPVDSESVTLLHTSDFLAFVGRVRKMFDLVLIDTPPLSLYADARILGRSSDGVVMVVRANKSSHLEIRNACEHLRQDDIPVLGTILNQWRMEPHESRAYGRYRYPQPT